MNIWGFPEIGVPPVIIHFRYGFSSMNHPAMGDHHGHGTPQILMLNRTRYNPAICGPSQCHRLDLINRIGLGELLFDVCPECKNPSSSRTVERIFFSRGSQLYGISMYFICISYAFHGMHMYAHFSTVWKTSPETVVESVEIGVHEEPKDGCFHEGYRNEIKAEMRSKPMKWIHST